MHILLPLDMIVTFRLVVNHLPGSPLTVAQNRHALVQRPGATPGAALSGADPASAVGGEAQATKAAVILPKPRVAPVQQPAVKHEEAVPAQKTAVKSEEAVPVQKPTVQEASPTPAVHRSSASRTFGCPS